MSEATAEKPATASIKAILGQKIGMTQIFDPNGQIIPVTVIQAGPCKISKVLSSADNGYTAVQMAFGVVREKSVNKPDAGQFKKSGIGAVKWMREFRVAKSDGFQVGQEVRADVFTPGDFVDVVGTSKGKGFAGAMKRHNFGGGPSTHGQSDRQRAPGSSGSNTYPGRVFKGKRFPGHLGQERVTVQHLEIVKVDPEQSLLMIRGAVPGTNDGLILIHETIKALKHRAVHAPEAGKKDKKKEPAKGAAPAAAAKGKGK